MVKQVILIVAVVLTGCANYQLGDFSRAYCGSTSEEFRAQVKAKLTDKGLTIGIDYCAAHGLVDMVVNDGN